MKNSRGQMSRYFSSTAISALVLSAGMTVFGQSQISQTASSGPAVTGRANNLQDMNDLFRRQFTFVSNTDHSDVAIVERFLEMIPAFAKSGGKHILLEKPPVVEQYWNLYKSGGLTDEELEKIVTDIPFLASGYVPDSQQAYANKLYIRLMKLAKEQGLEIHAQDQAEIKADKDYPDVKEAINESIRAYALYGTEEGHKVWNKYMQDPDFVRRQREYLRRFAQEREEADRKVAATLKSRVKDEKVLILYGEGHDAESHRLGYFLGKNNITIIPLLSKTSLRDPIKTFGGLADDWNFYAHFVAEDKTYKLRKDYMGKCVDQALSGNIKPCGDELPNVQFKGSLPFELNR